ncbi:MAG: RNA polymerase sigma factor [Thermoanaerobaculia bacterium]
MRNSWTGGEAIRTMPTVTDDLPVAVHRLEPGAFERLIERFESALFNYAHRILQNPFDAQEVVQDAFLRAHRALTRQYDAERVGKLAVRPWLFRIVRNLCFNKQRSKRRSTALEEPLHTFDDGRLGPFLVHAGSSNLEKKEELAQLDRAMSKLPVEARELIVLRFIEEMSYAEMSKTTGSNEASLRGKVFRSLKLLRDALDTKGVAHAM